VSGLETAIRNALERSEREDGQVRARIYQSARQALEAGLRKQGVTDNLVIMQQRKRLEDRIREIEHEEIGRLAQSAQPAVQTPVEPPQAERIYSGNDHVEPSVYAAGPAPAGASAGAAPEVAISVDPPIAPGRPAASAEALGGVTRSEASQGQAAAPSLDIGAPASDAHRDASIAVPVAEVPRADAGLKDGKRRGRGREKRTIAAERAAKPRRRRGFLSHLLTWIVTLSVVAVGCWIFYRSGMVQSIVDEAMQATDSPVTLPSSGEGPSALSSRGGFSEEWRDIFEPRQGAAFSAGAQAQAEIATGSEGQALRATSSSPDAAGDVAIEVPVEILRELAGKSSTLAVTIQSAANRPAQLSIRCDFGSLGSCARHRFTATQERQDALFRVSFDRTMAPNAPGRLLFNTGLGGNAAPVFVYSVRAFPGQ
jgi:hypothetical protein